MGTNKTEGFGEKVTEFFTQHKDDYEYEKAGGDGRVPEEARKGDPRGEARQHAQEHGESDPYPEDGSSDEGERAPGSTEL